MPPYAWRSTACDSRLGSDGFVSPAPTASTAPTAMNQTYPPDPPAIGISRSASVIKTPPPMTRRRSPKRRARRPISAPWITAAVTPTTTMK